MRLGGGVFYNGNSPEEFAKIHVEKGFGAAVCPHWVSLENPKELKEFQRVMKKHDVKIAEVGAWCNPLSTDPAEAKKNIAYMKERLRLAEELEANTCVNIIGSKNVHWCGACKEGYSKEFFDEAVAVSREIIDVVNPKHTKLSFEMMPFYFLDGPEEYLNFLAAVDREAAGVHLDLCNSINQPRRYYANTQFIHETFGLLRDKIVTLHLKDIRMLEEELTVKLEEVLLGTGNIDYVTLMEEIATLPEDTPAILEHLETEAEYDMAAAAAVKFAEAAGMRREGMKWVKA